MGHLQIARKKGYSLVLVLLLVVLWMGCATNPVTQKRELMLISDQQEVEMGRQGDKAVLAQFGRYGDEHLQGYIAGVGQRIAAVNHRQGLTYQYVILDSQVLNAFALPGGYVYITRGLLAYLNNEAQLASVLGHEVGHIAARHGVKKYQKAIGAQLLLTGIAIATESQGIVLGTNLLLSAVLQGYSRKDERQADELGALYMYRAGYDPIQMPAFFKILQDMERTSPNLIEQIFASHPPTSQRVEMTTAYAHDLTKGGRPGLLVERNRYISQLEGLVFGPGEREGLIEGSLYRNRYFRYQIKMPDGWKLKRGDSAGSVVARDPDGRFLTQVIPIELKSQLSPRELASQLERGSGLQPISSAWITVSGQQAYQADYRGRGEDGSPLGISIVYVTVEKTGFAIPIIAPLKDFNWTKRILARILSAFLLLAPEEAARIPLYRLKVYQAKQGDTFSSISEAFYGTSAYADDIKRFNGLQGVDQPNPGELIKIKPLLPKEAAEG